MLSLTGVSGQSSSSVSILKYLEGAGRRFGYLLNVTRCRSLFTGLCNLQQFSAVVLPLNVQLH